jgi:hypothetical protein
MNTGPTFLSVFQTIKLVFAAIDRSVMAWLGSRFKGHFRRMNKRLA